MAVGESPEQAASPTMPASTPASRMILTLRFMNRLLWNLPRVGVVEVVSVGDEEPPNAR